MKAIEQLRGHGVGDDAQGICAPSKIDVLNRGIFGGPVELDIH